MLATVENAKWEQLIDNFSPAFPFDRRNAYQNWTSDLSLSPFALVGVEIILELLQSGRFSSHFYFLHQKIEAFGQNPYIFVNFATFFASQECIFDSIPFTEPE